MCGWNSLHCGSKVCVCACVCGDECDCVSGCGCDCVGKDRSGWMGQP